MFLVLNRFEDFLELSTANESFRFGFSEELVNNLEARKPTKEVGDISGSCDRVDVNDVEVREAPQTSNSV